MSENEFYEHKLINQFKACPCACSVWNSILTIWSKYSNYILWYEITRRYADGMSHLPLSKFSNPTYLWFRSSSTDSGILSTCSKNKDVPKQNNFGIFQPLEHMLLRNCVLVRGQTLNDNLSYPKVYYHFIWRVWNETHL